MRKRLQNLTPEVVQARIANWIAERIDLGPLTGFLAKKTVPVHRHSWIYLLGGTALFLFGLQVVGGSLLMLYYQASEATAHESVRRIATEEWELLEFHDLAADGPAFIREPEDCCGGDLPGSEDATGRSKDAGEMGIPV